MTPNELRGGRVGAGPDEYTEVEGARLGPETPPADDELTAIVVDVPTPSRSRPLRDRPFEVGEGTMLGEYRIERLIGEGGMGTVFAAVHPLIGKRAAIKILKQELCTDPQSVERFVDEARVVNEIGHRNIVDIFAFGETPDGRNYFVMELLHGETLSARIATCRLRLPEVCSVLRPLARALQAAHAKGVIHRDLKPDNVFLVDERDQWLVKLLDFGIAKLSREDRRVERTAVGAMIGTPQYIAPEQARGRAIDHRVDIYSLGCVAFELLTGRSPFVADNAMEMIAKHLMEPPAMPSTLAAVPVELDQLVLAMLAKEAAARPSLEAVCAVLDRLGPPRLDLGSLPKATGPERAAAITWQPPVQVVDVAPSRRSRRVLWIAAGVVVAGVLGMAVTSHRPMDQTTSEPPRAEPPSARPPPSEPPRAEPPSARPPPSMPPPSVPPPSAPPPSAPPPPSMPPPGEPSAPPPSAPPERLDAVTPPAPEPSAQPRPRSTPAAPPVGKPRIRDIKLRVTPPTAELRLDAIVIGDAIAHVPLDGRPHHLTIRAPDFEPKTLDLDGSTAPLLHVQLTPKPPRPLSL